MSDKFQSVQLSDFMENGTARVGLRVRIRVPAKQRDRLGGEVVGEFRRFVSSGRRVLAVVKVGNRLLQFRPQDIMGPAA